MIYTPAGDGGFDVSAKTRRSASPGAVSRCWSRDTTSPTSRRSPISSSRLREIGVIAALERAGFEPGDEVRIGGEEFELHP